MTEQNLTAMEEQLARLQEAIVAKRVAEGTPPEQPLERAEVHQALGQEVAQAVPAFVPKQPGSSPVLQPSELSPELVQPVQDLVAIAFSQGPAVAIGRAMKSGNAALVDALHDVLADQFHEELLKRKKIAPAA